MPLNKYGRYYPERLSKDERQRRLSFSDAMFGSKGNTILPAKTKKNDSTEMDIFGGSFTYIDQNGIEQSIDASQVKNFGDSDYAETQKLFPNATPCFVKNTEAKYDAEGRTNVIGENLIIVDAIRMNSGEFGPGFMLQAIHQELGEVKLFAPGRTSEAIEFMCGIALEDKYDENKKLVAKAGERFRASELTSGMACRFIYVSGGKYDGYYDIASAVQELQPVE